MINSQEVAEILSGVGFDFLIIDGEHGSMPSTRMLPQNSKEPWFCNGPSKSNQLGSNGYNSISLITMT